MLHFNKATTGGGGYLFIFNHHSHSPYYIRRPLLRLHWLAHRRQQNSIEDDPQSFWLLLLQSKENKSF
jgi:hypothetical protein